MKPRSTGKTPSRADWTFANELIGLVHRVRNSNHGQDRTDGRVVNGNMPDHKVTAVAASVTKDEALGRQTLIHHAPDCLAIRTAPPGSVAATAATKPG